MINLFLDYSQNQLDRADSGTSIKIENKNIIGKKVNLGQGNSLAYKNSRRWIPSLNLINNPKVKHPS
jgi:hypothetical protein